jgi:hypothetical protein
MQRLLIQLAIASITFATGVTANIVFNLATRSLPDEDFPIVDIANGELHWTSPVLIRPFENHCGMLIVRIDSDRKAYLNSKLLGTIDNPDELLECLEKSLRVTRLFENDDYRYVSNGESSVRAVYLIASHELSYGEILDLGTKISDVGAYPVVLAADQLIH